MEFKATYKSNIYFVSTVGGSLLKSLRLLDLIRESKTRLAQFVENDTLDASHCHAQWATAEPLLRQAALSSSICKRMRHAPNPTRLTARQSGSSVEAESKRDEATDVVAEARCQSESRGESLLHSEPPAFRYGEVQYPLRWNNLPEPLNLIGLDSGVTVLQEAITKQRIFSSEQ